MKKGAWLGFAFFVALVILGFATLIVGDIDQLLRKNQYLTVHFTGVQGLREGDAVRVDGVQTGKVTKIALDPTAGVIVTARVSPPIQLYQDAEVLVEASSVLGGSFVSIRRGSQEPPRDLTRPLIGKTRPGIEQIGELAAENRDDVRQLFANLKDLTQALKEGKGSAGQLLQSRELHDEMVTTLRKAQESIAEVKKVGETLGKTAEQINKGEGPIGALLNDKQMTERINRTLENVEKSSDSLRKITEKVESGEGTAGRLINDKDMGERVKKSVENIEEATEAIKKITGKIANGEGTLGKIVQDEELYQKAKQGLEDVDKFFGRISRSVVEVVGDSIFYDDSQLQISKLGIRINLHSTRDFKPGELEDKYFFLGAAFLSLNKEGNILFENLVEDNENDTEIKAEVGLSYRIPWFLDRRISVRGGLIEGKPGGAMDVQWDNWLLFHHPVQLTYEIRDSYNDLDDEDIDEQLDGPLMRFYVKLPLWTRKDNWFELLLSTVRIFGGVSRIGEDPEAMVGIGLQWPDDDIRTLVGFIGLAQ